MFLFSVLSGLIFSTNYLRLPVSKSKDLVLQANSSFLPWDQPGTGSSFGAPPPASRSSLRGERDQVQVRTKVLVGIWKA